MSKTGKVLGGLAAVLVVIVALLVVVPRMIWGDHTDYSKVASIKTTPEYQDAALLEKAWALPVAQLYRKQIDYQGNGSFCGPTSVVNVSRSLGQPADQKNVLDGSGIRTFFGLVPGGLTLDQMGQLVERRLKAKVTVLRNLSLDDFKKELARANDPSVRYVVNFHRGPLFGRGGGHHSPIAGYLADQDLVLVLDVNHDYMPWLVHSDRLFAATDTLDKMSGKKRGLLRIESSP